MKIVAIMPTHSRRKMAANAIRSVFAQSWKPDVFLVLDNGSKDGTQIELEGLGREAISSGISTKFKVTRVEENLGAAGGMHFLFKKALEEGADWVWVMDDDAIANPTALRSICESKSFGDPDAYLLESKIIDANGEWSPPNRPAVFNETAFDFKGIAASSDQPGAEVEVHTGGYCGWFVRKECFRDFGFPRSDLYFWFDDIEYVVRVSRKKKVVLIMNSVIQHFATSLVEHEVKWPFSGPLPKIPFETLPRYFYWYRNYLWFAKQWLGPAKFVLFLSKHVVRGLATPVLFSQDHLIARWKMVLKASFDAVTEKLGRNHEG